MKVETSSLDECLRVKGAYPETLSIELPLLLSRRKIVNSLRLEPKSACHGSIPIDITLTLDKLTKLHVHSNVSATASHLSKHSTFILPPKTAATAPSPSGQVGSWP